MKKLVFLIFVLMVTTNLSAQIPIVLPDLQQPHQIAVDGNDLYIFDEADYSLHVYTISPFALKLKFGRKGEGPHDFKYLPFVYVQPESLACTDFTKIVWFSKKRQPDGDDHSRPRGPNPQKALPSSGLYSATAGRFEI